MRKCVGGWVFDTVTSSPSSPPSVVGWLCSCIYLRAITGNVSASDSEIIFWLLRARRHDITIDRETLWRLCVSFAPLHNVQVQPCIVVVWHRNSLLNAPHWKASTTTCRSFLELICYASSLAPKKREIQNAIGRHNPPDQSSVANDDGKGTLSLNFLTHFYQSSGPFPF